MPLSQACSEGSLFRACMVWGDVSQGRLSEVEQVLPFIRFPMMTQQELLVSKGLVTCNNLVCFQQVPCEHTVFCCKHSCCRQHGLDSDIWATASTLMSSRFCWSKGSKSSWQQPKTCCPNVMVQSTHSCCRRPYLQENSPAVQFARQLPVVRLKPLHLPHSQRPVA